MFVKVEMFEIQKCALQLLFSDFVFIFFVLVFVFVFLPVYKADSAGSRT